MVTWWDTWGFHGDENSCCHVLGWDTIQWCGRIPTFWRTMLPPSSGWSEWQAIHLEDEGCVVLQNIGIPPHPLMVSQTRGLWLEKSNLFIHFMGYESIINAWWIGKDGGGSNYNLFQDTVPVGTLILWT